MLGKLSFGGRGVCRGGVEKSLRQTILRNVNGKTQEKPREGVGGVGDVLCSGIWRRAQTRVF